MITWAGRQYGLSIPINEIQTPPCLDPILCTGYRCIPPEFPSCRVIMNVIHHFAAALMSSI